MPRTPGSGKAGAQHPHTLVAYSAGRRGLLVEGPLDGRIQPSQGSAPCATYICVYVYCVLNIMCVGYMYVCMYVYIHDDDDDDDDDDDNLFAQSLCLARCPSDILKFAN